MDNLTKEFTALKKLKTSLSTSAEIKLERDMAAADSNRFGGGTLMDLYETEKKIELIEKQLKKATKEYDRAKKELAKAEKDFKKKDELKKRSIAILNKFYTDKIKFLKDSETNTKKKIESRKSSDKTRASSLRFIRTSPEIIEEPHKNLYEVFMKLKKNIDQGFEKKMLSDDDGVLYSLQLAQNFEIVLVLNRSTDKFTLITVRFRKNGDLYSCLKLSLNNVDKETITIEKVNINRCPERSENCVITLALLFCTFLQKSIVELKDYDAVGEQGLSYRNMKFSEQKSSKLQKQKMYSHDFSYFSPYGFEDYAYDDLVPVATDCHQDDRKFCQMNDDLIEGNKMIAADTTTYVLMQRRLPLFDKFNEYLLKIKVNENQSLSQLCENLKCNNDSEICQSDIFYKLKSNTSQVVQNKTVPDNSATETEDQTDQTEDQTDQTEDQTEQAFGNVTLKFPYTSRF